MNNLGDSLNLRPQEKRIIVVIAIIVFVVLNLVLVFPHFKDYGIYQKQLLDTRGAILKDKRVIELDNKPGGLKEQLAQLQNGNGGVIASTPIELQKTITDQATGVFIQTSGGVTPTRIGPESLADKFFESESIHMVVQAAEEPLVKFLYNVGNDPAMIRVRELELHPLDNNRYKLNAAITFTADYQRTVAPKKAAPILTPASVKTAAKAPTNASPTNAARSPATNATPAPPGKAPTPPAPSRAVAPPAPGRAGTPPAPGRAGTPPTPGRAGTPPTPGRAGTPPTPGQTNNLPPVPPRPPRNQT
jgi:hypothetical protein